MDGFIHVVRCFEDENVPHPSGSIDPLRDIHSMDSEFVLNDLIAVERKLERLAEERKKGAGRDKAIIEREMQLFERLHVSLGKKFRCAISSIDAEEEKLLAGFGFLSRKPVLIVLNLSEGQTAPVIDYTHQHSKVVALQGKLEMDIAQLPPEEVQMFLEEYGIEEPSLNRMIRLSYDLLGLQSFFTVGPDEVRAWTIRRGATAPEAAGEIHTDLQKGFIRAEVVSYDDLMTLGGMNEAKARRQTAPGRQRIHRQGWRYSQYPFQHLALDGCRMNKKRGLALALTLVVLALAAALGPTERTLGTHLRLVLLHGAWVWTGKLAFGASAVMGLAALIVARPAWHRLCRALGWVGLAFWLTYLPMSLWVMQLNWGGIAWGEPRWRLPLAFGVAGVLLQIAFALFRQPRLTSLGNFLYAVALWVVLGGAQNMLHPDLPIFGGGDGGIQLHFMLLLGLCLLLAGQLTAWWCTSHPPTD